MSDIMKMGKNPNYLGSWDIEDQPNREVVLTIERIVDEEVITNTQKEVCTVIHWTDKSFKPMIANVTNKKTLCKLYKTKETENLVGKSVAIGIERVKAFGDVHDALRIRKRIPVVKSDNIPKCEQCGKELAAYGNMTPEQLAAYTKKKYGRVICADCATKGAQ